MKSINHSDHLFDFSSSELPGFLFRNLGSGDILPFWVKCAGIFALLYILGIVANFSSNTLFPWTGTGIETPYIMDYSFLIVCIVSSGALAYLLLTLRKLDDVLLQLNKRLDVMSNPDNERAFEEFTCWIKQGMPFSDRFFGKAWFWYYLETVGGAILGAAYAVYWSMSADILFWGRAEYLVSSIYYIFFCAIVGYIIGNVIFVTIGSIKAVRRYCKTFIPPEKIFALNPDKVGGLRPLGQFSLRLDITFALPSFVAFGYFAQGVSIGNLVIATVLIIYTLILVVVFFLPLSAAHNSMLEAKERAYDQVNEIFKEVNSKLFTSKNYNLKQIKTLKDVHFLHQKIAKMAVWPLNLSLVLKFIATSSFPIVGSLVVTYISTIVGL